jgi:hypothetical protein
LCNFAKKGSMVVSNLVKIGGAEVAVKEYRGQRVVTFKDIDQCHGRAVKELLGK